jgi:hypothetical protein
MLMLDTAAAKTQLPRPFPASIFLSCFCRVTSHFSNIFISQGDNLPLSASVSGEGGCGNWLGQPLQCFSASKAVPRFLIGWRNGACGRYWRRGQQEERKDKAMAMVEGMEHHSPGPAWLLKELVLAIYFTFSRYAESFFIKERL